jgi:hypothetical protein
MASLVLTGDTSGQVTISAPAVAGSNTLTLQAATATSAVNTRATAVASTSGTAIDFTALPSWIKRVTVLFNETSLSASASLLVQIGSGSVTNTGYIATGNFTNQSSSTAGVSSTSGFPVYMGSTTYAFSGALVIYLVSGNTYVANHSGKCLTIGANFGGGSVTLGGALDRVRITTSNGTDTFDAGTINILYEG